MGFETDPSLKYEAEDEGMQKAFEKDAGAMANGKGDKADTFDIPDTTAEADPSGDLVGNAFLQKVVSHGAEVKEKEADAEKADELLATELGQEKGPVDGGKPVQAQQSAAEKAPEVAETAEVAQGEIAKEQKEVAQRAGDLMREGSDKAEA